MISFKDFSTSYDKKLNEGGNVMATNKQGVTKFADKIDLQKFHILSFRDEFYKLFSTLNRKFKAKYNEPLWHDDAELKKDTFFNGSTSYIMDPTLNPNDILKVKKHAGDVDIMIPSHLMSNLWELLHSLENEKLGNFTYFGNNRQNKNAIGTQINALFIYHHKEGDIACQVDFEEAEFENNKPTKWSKFAHGSSFKDASVGIKAFHHKLLLRALVGAISYHPDVVIATPASNADKITLKKTKEVGARMKQFSVDRGLGQGLEAIIGHDGKPIYMDGKLVVREKKSTEKEYLTDLEKIFESLFHTRENIDKFYSFVGLVSLIKKHCKASVIQDTQKRYFDILFGKYSAQIIETFSPKDDAEVKIVGYSYFLDKLNLKHNNLQKEIEDYYKANETKFTNRNNLRFN